MGFFKGLFGDGPQGSNIRTTKPELTVENINFFHTTANSCLFTQVFSALETHFVSYRDSELANHSFSDLSEHNKEEKYFDILSSFIDQRFHGDYIVDLHTSLDVITPNEVYAEEHNLWHAEKSLQMLKHQLSFCSDVYGNNKHGKASNDFNQFDENHGRFKNSKISTKNLQLFFIKYNDLINKIKEIKQQIGLTIIENEPEWPYFFKITEPKTYNWKFGAIPIIPKYKHMPLGHLSGAIDQYVSTNLFMTKSLLKDLKNELNQFSDYVFLANHGGDYGFYSVFKYPINSALIDDYQKLMTFELGLIDVENSSFFIENMSLDQIKKTANEIKEKINEHRRIEQEERFKLIQQKAAEVEKIRKFEKWCKIKDLVKHEIIDKYNEPLAGIYLIHCESNNGIYIGSTENFHKRRLQHLYSLRKLSHHSYKLQDSFNTYGEENLRFYALETIKPDDNSHKNKRKLKLIEQDYLGRYVPDLNIERDAFGKKHYYF